MYVSALFYYAAMSFLIACSLLVEGLLVEWSRRFARISGDIMPQSVSAEVSNSLLRPRPPTVVFSYTCQDRYTISVGNDSFV